MADDILWMGDNHRSKHIVAGDVEVSLEISTHYNF
jgi:hypothetical protein